MKTNSKKLSPKQLESIKDARILRDKSIWKLKGKIVSFLYDFYEPFIENPPINSQEIDARREITAIALYLIENIKEYESYKYDKFNNCIGAGVTVEKEITDEEELLSIKGILTELESLYQEYAYAQAFKRKSVLNKIRLIKYLLSSWLYKNDNIRKNILNNYKNLYTIISTINTFGEELETRDFNRMDCIYFYATLTEITKNKVNLSDTELLNIFVAFINKNIWRDALLTTAEKIEKHDKINVDEHLYYGNHDKDIYRLAHKNESFTVVKINE